MWPHRDSGQRALERKAHKERARKEKSRLEEILSGIQKLGDRVRELGDWLRRVDPELRALKREVRVNEGSSLRAAFKASQAVAEANRVGRQVKQLTRARDKIQRAAANSGIPFPTSTPLYLLILEVYSIGDKAAQGAACEALFYYREAALNNDPLPGFLRSMRKKWRSLLCSRCFCRFEPHQMRDGNWVTKAVKFYACRQCHRVSTTIEGVQKVVVAVDRSMKEPYTISSDGLLVNWLAHKEPLDLDEVLIQDVGDDDIEELAMKERNDGDEKRRRRYRSIPVRLGPSLRLSQAKLNLLKDTFGHIETMSGTIRR